MFHGYTLPFCLKFGKNKCTVSTIGKERRRLWKIERLEVQLLRSQKLENRERPVFAKV
jgi:hypothetical protein